MGDFDEWYQLAIGDVISEVKKQASIRLMVEFGIVLEEILGEIRIDAMRNADRTGDSYRIFVKRNALFPG